MRWLWVVVGVVASSGGVPSAEAGVFGDADRWLHQHACGLDQYDFAERTYMLVGPWEDIPRAGPRNPPRPQDSDDPDWHPTRTREPLIFEARPALHLSLLCLGTVDPELTGEGWQFRLRASFLPILRMVDEHSAPVFAPTFPIGVVATASHMTFNRGAGHSIRYAGELFLFHQSNGQQGPTYRDANDDYVDNSQAVRDPASVVGLNEVDGSISTNFWGVAGHARYTDYYRDDRAWSVVGSLRMDHHPGDPFGWVGTLDDQLAPLWGSVHLHSSLEFQWHILDRFSTMERPLAGLTGYGMVRASVTNILGIDESVYPNVDMPQRYRLTLEAAWLRGRGGVAGPIVRYSHGRDDYSNLFLQDMDHRVLIGIVANTDGNYPTEIQTRYNVDE